MEYIEIIINNKKERITKPCNIAALLEQKNISSLGLAVAVNQQVISKSQWSETFLEHQQEIMLIRATQGG